MPGFELKLSISADDLPKARAALVAMAGRPRPTRATLATTYYDTEDDALRRRELVLRVRKEGRQFVQTLAARDLAGIDRLERGAWQDRIKGAVPDLDAPETGARLREATTAEALAPLFTVSIERTAFVLKPRHGSEIAVAIDNGEIRADDGDTAPVHEIALTLQAGESVVLWDVALRLLEIVPCRIETQSKGERGFFLARGARMRPLVVPGRALTLDAKMTLDEALQAAGRRLIAALLCNEAAALDSVPEGVHQMRVAVRRLRAVLSASRDMLPEEHYRWANDELKWLGRELAPARNWDVFAEALLEPVSGALAGDRDLKRLAATARRQRKTAYEHAREAVLSQRYTATLLRLARWFEARGWRDQSVSEQSARLMAPLGKIAPTLLGRLHRKALKRARRFATLPPPDRHRLRIAVKQLRYAIEFFASLYDRGDVTRYARRLKPLQEDLGHANDVRSAHALVAGLGKGEDGALERAGGVVLGWYDRGLVEAEPKTRKHVRRFRAGAPFW
ncbi:MAG TPA: CHAD domain-containing protein [Stellaceae bacterium]|nr:CHAD domain-containing protein [Stellaceae bacterium]